MSIVLSLSLLKTQGKDFPPPADPYADPANDPSNPLRYIASNVLTAIAFSVILMTALIQTYWIKRWGAKWMMSMTIGAYTFAFGIGTRFGLHAHPESKGIYIVEYLFVVLSPCAFIAANYVLLGRLSRYLGATEHMLVKPRRITTVFISSDVITFLIQAAGGAVSISADNMHLARIGSRIFLVGLVLQLGSFFILTCIFLTFLWRIYAHKHDIWEVDAVGGKMWYNDWRALAGALFVSCIGILIRSVYRTIELSEGFEGQLATMESFFYGLDTLPLFIAVAIYVPFWPGRFIPPVLVEHKTELKLLNGQNPEGKRDL
ncbi:RTA1-domain-containing protein [Desarmillaria ectypa]|nr:RTA1-domain-containing protein [Desarmillaria ectypa]